MCDEMLPNRASIAVFCGYRSDYKPCVYFKKSEADDKYCKYDIHKNGMCGSAVAQANAMTIRLKKLGIG